LASRIKQEVGPFLTHSSISGNVTGFEGLYNFYNIGATSSNEPMGAIKNGLTYARDGKGANEQVKQKYLIPWNTREKAIKGGAKALTDVATKLQKTLYKYMKKMDGFVLESRYEGQGIVILEAKALGLDLIIPTHLKEYIEDVPFSNNLINSLNNAKKKNIKEIDTLEKYNNNIKTKLNELFKK